LGIGIHHLPGANHGDPDPEVMQQWLQDDFQWKDDHLKSTLNISGPNIRALLFRLANELRSPGFGSDALVELIAAQITLGAGSLLHGDKGCALPRRPRAKASALDR